MPTVTTRTEAARVSSTDHARSAADIGNEVLEALKNTDANAELTVPAALVKGLAEGLVELAKELAALSNASGQPAGRAAPQVQAELTVTSAYSGGVKQYEQLQDLASKVRIKCADLGIKLKAELGSDMLDWQLKISGQADKAKLDKVRDFIKSELTGIGLSKLGEIRVDNYELQ